jgi:mono/diheme cytochrome c family protein
MEFEMISTKRFAVLTMGLWLPVAAFAAPVYQDVARIVDTNCLGCHGADTAFGDILLDSEESLKLNAAAALEAITAGTMPAGDETFRETEDGKLLLEYLREQTKPAEPTYAEIAPILQANCLSCHGAVRPRKGVRLDTEAFARQNAGRAAGELQQGAMPPRRPDFARSADGQRLLQWLNSAK